MFGKMTVEDVNVRGKRVLVRVDFNVPLASGEVTDDRRIRLALKTINYLVGNGAKVILMSHLGRPKGKVVDSLKMDPVARRLSELLGRPVKKLNDCVGEKVKEAVAEMNDGDVILLENLRFHPEEKANDDGFASKLASLGELYVNDAFSVSHRAHASVVGITRYLPAVAGFALKEEVEHLSKVKESPEHPFVVILGGAKVSDKIGVIRGLEEKADKFLIGGGMAYTFLKAKGLEIGNSLCEEDKLELASGIMDELSKKGKGFILPVDVLVVKGFEDKDSRKVVGASEIPESYMGVDIGPGSVRLFGRELQGAKTVLWNGPVGVFEIDEYAKGTKGVAEAVVGLKGCFSVAGGGDTAAAIKKFGLESGFSFISSGGGASLEFFSEEELPGIAALMDRE